MDQEQQSGNGFLGLQVRFLGLEGVFRSRRLLFASILLMAVFAGEISRPAMGKEWLWCHQNGVSRLVRKLARSRVELATDSGATRSRLIIK